METSEQRAEGNIMQLGGGIDVDDNLYRRLTTGTKLRTRDLTPLSADRALEVSWYLFEQNPFAHRLVTLMTDLIIGEGMQIQVLSDDRRIAAVIDQFWQRNQIGARLRSFYMANSLNGELIFPTAINEFSGGLVLGYVDSCQVKAILPAPDNVLDVDRIDLKGTALGEGGSLKVIRENPATGMLEGDAFFLRINALPNSMRGRPDLMPLADWLDLYDQFMFAEVERLNLLSSFAWDYEIKGAKTDEEIKEKIKAMPRLKPGAVFGHNENETLTPRTPDFKAADRSEVARLLRVHIAGSYGFPVSYLGDIDSNNATIQGQNDVMMKTPAARQKEFVGLLDQMVRFAIQQAVGKNPALFTNATPDYRITVPEIATKDLARIGTVMASIVTAMDTGIANETVSRGLAIRVIAGLIKQLGVDADPQEIAEEIATEQAERADAADLLQTALAGRQGNPPVPSGSAEPVDEPDAVPY